MQEKSQGSGEAVRRIAQMLRSRDLKQKSVCVGAGGGAGMSEEVCQDGKNSQQNMPGFEELML